MPSSVRPGVRVEPPVHAPNAALLIDFDNVTLGVRSEFTKELRTLLNSDIIKGKVAVQRAYADWRRYPQYIVPLSESSIDLIFAPAFGSVKKNATDIRLAIDAIELVFTRPEIGTFILLSGDSDFSMLVIKLKEYGKYVIGVGIRESASDILIQNCDEYFSYSDLAGLTKEADTPSAQRDPWELVREAAVQMQRNGDVMRSDRLKQVMQQIDPNFDERNAGYNRFSKFVSEAGNRGLITVSKLDNGQYEVAPGEAAATPAPAPRREEPRRGRVRDGARAEGGQVAAEAGAHSRNGDESREGGRRRGRRGRGRGGRDRAEESGETPSTEARPAQPGGLALAQAFNLMREALAQLSTPTAHETLRLRMSALHGRDDAMLTSERFPKLLRQANDAEVADVRKLGDDEYEVSLHPTEDPRARAGIPARPAAPAPDAVETRAKTPVARSGVRSRPGASRLPGRSSGLQLVGVVSLDDEAPGSSGEAPAAVAEPKKRARGGAKKSGRQPESAEPGAAAKTPPGDRPAKPARPRRPRARAAKKTS